MHYILLIHLPGSLIPSPSYRQFIIHMQYMIYAFQHNDRIENTLSLFSSHDETHCASHSRLLHPHLLPPDQNIKADYKRHNLDNTFRKGIFLSLLLFNMSYSFTILLIGYVDHRLWQIRVPFAQVHILFMLCVTTRTVLMVQR